MGVLDGKVVLVTGGANGIGKECALLAAKNGAKVLVNDLGGSASGGDEGSAGPAQLVANEIKAAGGVAVANSESVTNRAAVKRMFEQARDELGGIHAVINPAGILRDKMFHKMDDQDWDMVIDVHLNGAYNVARYSIEQFREQGEGSYVLFTSTSGIIGNIGQANYAAAKMGIAGLSRSIALDMSRFHVRSNCISPFAWSRMIGAIPTDTPEQAARVEKLKQMTPDKIAAVAVYLASDAAREVTGQIFAVRNNEVFLMSQPRPIRGLHRDGGWTPETLAEEVGPAFRSMLVPLERSADVFSWDPV